MKKLFFLSLMLISVNAFACECMPRPLVERHQSADYVATAKILKMLPDKQDPNHFTLEIFPTNVYKGKPGTTLIEVFYEPCSPFPSENSTWLIFATDGKKGLSSFEPCSGNLLLDRVFTADDSIRYPNAERNYKKSIELKLSVLEFLKKQKITEVNEYDLKKMLTKDCFSDLKGYTNNNSFVVFKVKVNEDLTIGKISTLQAFDNSQLSNKLFNCLKENLKINIQESPKIPRKTSLMLIYYYYPAEAEYQSFIGAADL